jgi:HSP20 family protein
VGPLVHQAPKEFQEVTMKLTKAAPTTPLIREDFENLFDRLFGRGVAAQPSRVFETIWVPSLDFSENEKEYIVRLEAPGIPKDDLEVNLEGQILTISGRRNFEKEEQSEEYFWREREQGRFVRTVRLPSAVNPTKVEASYNDGVMTIRVPKAESSTKSRIPIK